MSTRILIITARFNELITNELHRGAVSELSDDKDILVEEVSVPGAFELPVAAAVAARSKKYDAVLCLGCVIRGETAHFDYVAGNAATGILNVGIETGVPIIFGVLTTDTEQQALARCGLKGGNKGREAAQSALSMIKTLRRIKDHRD